MDLSSAILPSSSWFSGEKLAHILLPFTHLLTLFTARSSHASTEHSLVSLSSRRMKHLGAMARTWFHVFVANNTGRF